MPLINYWNIKLQKVKNELPKEKNIDVFKIFIERYHQLEITKTEKNRTYFQSSINKYVVNMKKLKIEKKSSKIL